MNGVSEMTQHELASKIDYLRLISRDSHGGRREMTSTSGPLKLPQTQGGTCASPIYQ